MPVPRSEYLSGVWRDGVFANRVVYCTGGAGTICSAQVRAMVLLGANACIIGRNEDKTVRMAQDIATARKGAKVIGIGSVDVRKIDSVQASVDKCVQELGGIDFVIAGAAGNFLAPISKLSANAFRSVIDIDVLGSFNTVKATMPHLYESAAKHKFDEKIPGKIPGGRILFVSAGFHYTGTPFQTHVAVAKAGVDALSASLAIEAGPRGITSNVITPGGIKGTEGLKRLSTGEYEKAVASIPLGREGSIKDIADATVYLFSDCGSYVNGEVLVVDGGAWRTQGASVFTRYPDVFKEGDGASKAKL